MKLKYHTITKLTGGSFSNNMRETARAVNRNADVLKELCQYVEKLEKRIDKLENCISEKAGGNE